MNKPRVVVVDDHQLFRSGVKSEITDGCTVVGEAGSVSEAIAVISSTNPDVVLLDVHLPEGGGVSVIEQTRSVNQTEPPHFLALSVSDEPSDVVAVVQAGALGYVTKTISKDELIDAIHKTAEGEPVFGPKLATYVLRAFTDMSRAAESVAQPAVNGSPSVRVLSDEQAPNAANDTENKLDALTAREREVLHHLARGYSYKQIGLRLQISPRTVETHVSSVLRKMQMTSRHELSHWVANNGML